MASTAESGGNKSFWKGDLPSWLAGTGTIAIAVVGLLTLPPLIENLALRDRNLELSESNKKLQREIAITQSERIQLQRDLDYLQTQIRDGKAQQAALQEHLANLQVHQRDLLQVIVKMSANVNVQTERELELRDRLKTLESQVKTLEIKRDDLEIKNRRLVGERSEIEDKLQVAQKELTRISNELQSTYRINRRFILQQIKTKTVNIFPLELEIPSPIPLASVRSMVRWEIDVLLLKMRHPDTLSTKEPSTGEKAVVEEFDSQVFNLLPDSSRLLFKDAIQKFMDGNKEIFSTNLTLDRKVVLAFFKARDSVSKTVGSEYYGENLAFDKSERVSQDETKAREFAYEKAIVALESERTRVLSARRKLHEVMDRMVVELTDLK